MGNKPLLFFLQCRESWDDCIVGSWKTQQEKDLRRESGTNRLNFIQLWTELKGKSTGKQILEGGQRA